MLNNQERSMSISVRLFGFLVLGLGLIFFGIAVLVVASIVGGGSGSVGGVVFIGPIPIVFGAGQDATTLIVISVIVAVLSMVTFFVMSRRIRRNEG
jgi:uncharacterized membrane protein